MAIINIFSKHQKELRGEMPDVYTYNEIENKGFSKRIIGNVIEELNGRFKEHGVDYQYKNGQIISVNPQLIHAEVVRPALQLLSDKDHTGAEQ